MQVAGSVLAAVTAAWLASRLGVAGTMIGVALGSFVATVSSAIYARTLDKGKTLLAQTASGTLVERTVQDGEIAEALDDIAESERSTVRSAEVIEEDKPLRWKAIIITTVVVALLALGAITTYELVSDKTLGGSGGTTIGDTFGGGKSDKGDSGDTNKNDDDSDSDKDKDKDAPDRTDRTTDPNRPGNPNPAPTASTPAPTRTATPAPTRPTATPRPEPTSTLDAPEPTEPEPRSVE